MISLFRAEMMKIRRSLIWLVVITIPAFMAFIFFLGIRFADEQITWQMLVMGSSGLWAFFLLPMSATVITALLGQVEHRPGTWSYALSQPHSKFSVLLTKGIIAILFIGLISIILYWSVIGSVTLASQFNPDGAPLGSVPYDYYRKFIYRIWVASILMTAIQFYVAMRFSGMALPLLAGVGGTLFSAVAMATSVFGLGFDAADYLPWVLPGRIMEQSPQATDAAMLLGGGGGALALLFLCWLLSRKDWT